MFQEDVTRALAGPDWLKYCLRPAWIPAQAGRPRKVKPFRVASTRGIMVEMASKQFRHELRQCHRMSHWRSMKSNNEVLSHFLDMRKKGARATGSRAKSVTQRAFHLNHVEWLQERIREPLLHFCV